MRARRVLVLVGRRQSRRRRRRRTFKYVLPGMPVLLKTISVYLLEILGGDVNCDSTETMKRRKRVSAEREHDKRAAISVGRNTGFYNIGSEFTSVVIVVIQTWLFTVSHGHVLNSPPHRRCQCC